MPTETPIALNLARLLHRLLVNPRGWRVESLLRELDIRPRTYRKYRGLLRDHLEPLIDPAGRWKVVEVDDGGTRYLRLRVDDPAAEDQPGFLGRVAGLWLARRLLAFAGDSELRNALEGAWSDLREGVADKPFYLGHLLLNTDRMVHVVPDAPKDYAGREEAIERLLHGLFFTRRIAFEYNPASGRSRSHVVCPLTLALWRSALYLVAAYEPEGKPYLFAVDRMDDVRDAGGRFRYPSARDYDPERLFEGAFGVFVEADSEPTAVKLRFAADTWLHRYLQERTWHPSQRFVELEDGRLEMSFEVTSMVEVWPWIRSFGQDVEVLRPKGEEGIP